MHRITKLALVVAIAAAPLAANARQTWLDAFNSKYGTVNTRLDTCNTCHDNPYGDALRARASMGAASAINAIDGADSDGDGFANGVEALALKFPGDPRDFPAPAAAPKISVAPASLALGTVTIGNSASQTTTVSNTGTGELTVSSVSRCNGTSAEFSASPAGPFKVAPGGTQAITVQYKPVDATNDSGCIQIAHDDATTGTVSVAVSGTGQAAPSAVLDVDITRFVVGKRVDISRGGTVTPKAAVVNAGTVAGTATVHLEGTVPDATGAPAVVYTASQDVTLLPAAAGKVVFPTFVPTTPAIVTWTLTVADADADVDTATATTKVVP
ncbi:MAG TPA: choice-of-anchor D domain-containing protein [Anaeromyxobacter sp.]|nr:choice-of-anchor D domain-containing protein [Anaeromyxobacter sp.]